MITMFLFKKINRNSNQFSNSQDISSNSNTSNVDITDNENNGNKKTHHINKHGNHHYFSIDIKSFSSVVDAQNHGWSFKEVIGKFNNNKLFKLATFNNTKWLFNGLYTGDAQTAAVLPDNIRLFGKLCYKKIT